MLATDVVCVVGVPEMCAATKVARYFVVMYTTVCRQAASAAGFYVYHAAAVAYKRNMVEQQQLGNAGVAASRAAGCLLGGWLATAAASLLQHL
jgi:hypothetical protein